MRKQVITFLMLIVTVFTVNAQKTVSGVKVDAKLNLEGQSSKCDMYKAILKLSIWDMSQDP